jgi:hypothetical protein
MPAQGPIFIERTIRVVQDQNFPDGDKSNPYNPVTDQAVQWGSQ